MAKAKNTGTKQAESVARLEAIIAATVDAVITIDENRIIEAFNPAAEKMFGYSASEAIGQNVKILMPEPYTSEHDQYVENYKNTGEKRSLVSAGKNVDGTKTDASFRF